MKIVHVVMGKANPFKMNGVNKSVHNLCKFQQRLGHSVELWGITKTPEAPTPKREYPLRLFQANLFRFVLHHNLKLAIRDLPTDCIIHFHGVLIAEFYALSRKLRQRSIQWVVSPRGAYSPIALSRRKLVKKIYFFLFERRFLGQASAVHTLTPMEKSWVAAWYPEARIYVIPNGEDQENITFTFSVIEASERPVFGFCGRLEHHLKGLDILLAGFYHYRKQGGKGCIWLIGDGISRKMLEKYVRDKGLQQDVHFLGPMFGAEKFNRLANIDVFVHTSRSEGISNAVLEAAALGKPLLLSKGTNMAEDIEQWQCGVALSKNTFSQVAYGLKKCADLYARKELETLGANALRMVQEKYSYKVVTKRLVDEVYRPLLG